MRTLTLQDRAALECAAGFTSHLRVRVLRGAEWVDLSTMLGGDMVMGAKWSTNLDAQVAQATLSIARNGPGGRGLSLAPLVTGSALNAAGPLLRVGAWVVVEVATVPLGTPRSSPMVLASWREVFRGRVDSLDVGAEEINATCLDAAGVIQDTFIEAEREYGSDAGTPVQTIMQAILNDWGLGVLPGQFGAGLYVPVDPLSMRGKYIQKTGPVLDALRELAGQIGWDVRYRWRADTNAWALTLWSPDRFATAPVWRYGPAQYVELSSVAQSLADIRTDVEVVYSDKADKDSTGLAKRKKAYAENLTARALYGRRWMQVAEASTSNINTAPEAQRLADAAVADLSRAALQVTMRLQGVHWHLEASDLVAVGANGVHFDADQFLGVTSIECECGSNGEARTTVQLRGAPSTSIMQWMQREAAPGCAPSAPFTGPSAPVGLVPTPTVNGFALTFQASATGAAWDSYELHVSQSSGFAPSSGTFKQSSRTTRFEVADLLPGTNYYARVVGRDRAGNLGAASGEVALAPRYIEPRMLQPYVSIASLPLNPDFEAANVSGAPPDGWTMRTGSWGSSATLTGDSYTGQRALLLANGGTALCAQPIAVRPGTRYSIDLWGKGSDALSTLLIDFEWLDGNQAVLDISTVVSASGKTTFARFSGLAAGPASTRYMRIVARLPASTGARTFTLDSCVFASVDSIEESPRTATTAEYLMGGTGWQNAAALPPVQFSRASTGQVLLSGSMSSGAVGAALRLPDPAYYPARDVTFVTYSLGGTATVKVDTLGFLNVVAFTSNTRVCLDGVVYRGVV
ncbi:hypothetical protein DRW03_21335 [Corallococcus sp. H22C18031201]|nr:hypothetical protein DRW03_21335 [Corallococcus sp. H22C18031201]